MQEVGRTSGDYRQVNASELELRVQMLQQDQEDCSVVEEKNCYARYQACLSLTVVFTIIAATIVIIIYVSLGGLRGGGM